MGLPGEPSIEYASKRSRKQIRTGDPGLKVSRASPVALRLQDLTSNPGFKIHEVSSVPPTASGPQDVTSNRAPKIKTQPIEQNNTSNSSSASASRVHTMCTWNSLAKSQNGIVIMVAARRGDMMALNLYLHDSVGPPEVKGNENTIKCGELIGPLSPVFVMRPPCMATYNAVRKKSYLPFCFARMGLSAPLSFASLSRIYLY